MFARGLRRMLDDAYTAGYHDGAERRPPDPVRPSWRDGDYWRMAYTAGYHDALDDGARFDAELERRRAAGIPPPPPPNTPHRRSW
jgi:hypothetical protein